MDSAVGRDRAPLIGRSLRLSAGVWRRLLAAMVTAGVPVVFLTLLVIWPLIAVLVRSMAGVGASDVLEIVGRPSVRSVLAFTVWQATVSALGTLCVGLPIAHVLARYRFWGRDVIRAVVIVPFVLPTVVVAAAFGALFDRFGLELDRSVWAVLAAHIFFNVAVVVRIVGGFWARVDQRPAEVAATLGAGPFHVLRTITVRQLAPVLAGSFLLVFLFSFTSFGVIRVLGGLRRATIETEIYRFAIARQEFEVAAVLAGIQVVVVAVLAVVTARFQRRHADIGNRADRATKVTTMRQRLHLVVVCCLAIAVIGVPMAVLVEQSLTVGTGYGFGNYARLLERSPLLPVSAAQALVTSILFAIVAAAVAAVVGILASIAIERGGPTGRALEAFALLPLGVSAVTLGFGYLVGLTAFDLNRQVWLVPVAHAVIGLPFVLAAMVPALRSIDPRVREAAAVLGASPRAVRMTVDWPLVRRAIATGAGFAAAVSIGEFGATSFLARGAGSFTAPLAVFRLLSNPGQQLRGQALALCVVIGVLVAAMATLIEYRRDDGVSLL